MSFAYFDASALCKLALHEPESGALARCAAGFGHVATSVLGRIEFERAVRRRCGMAAEGRVAAVLDQFDIVPLDIATSAIAGLLPPRSLRSLDAIHLATIEGFRGEVDCVFCYDRRLADAARDRGFDVRAPA